MRIGDWSSDVCSSDLRREAVADRLGRGDPFAGNDRVLDALQLAQVTSAGRSEEHTSELQSLMRISYAVFCLKKKNCNFSLSTLPYPKNALWQPLQHINFFHILHPNTTSTSLPHYPQTISYFY